MSEEGVQALLMCISQRPCGQLGVFKLASLFLWTPLVVTLPPLHIMDDTAHVFFFVRQASLFYWQEEGYPYYYCRVEYFS